MSVNSIIIEKEKHKFHFSIIIGPYLSHAAIQCSFNGHATVYICTVQ